MRTRNRWGFGPVFAYECLTVPRRWQIFAGRALFIGAMLLGMWLLWAPDGTHFTTIEEMSQFGTRLFQSLIIVQIVVVMLVAPVATAGSICVDKSRGTLFHVFLTDLSDREIVLGKLSARLLTVLTLLTCATPVLAIGGLLGGVPYDAIVSSFLVSIGLAIFAASLAMLLSVWVRKPHHALLTTYACLGLWLAILPIATRYQWISDPVVGAVCSVTNPIMVALGPYASGRNQFTLIYPAGVLVACIVVSSILVFVTIRKLRSVAIGQLDRPRKRKVSDAPSRLPNLTRGPSLDTNPVLWREWHRKQGAKWTRRFWTAYVLASCVIALYVINTYFVQKLNNEHVAAIVNGWAVAIGLLLLTISATTSLAEERDRGSLDVIMTTPLPSSTILWGKWWGTFAIAPLLAILPVWISINLAIVSGNFVDTILTIGQILSMSAAVTSMGIAIATWIPRLGRAISMGVVIYAVFALGILLIHYSMPTIPRDSAPLFRRVAYSSIDPSGKMVTRFVNVLVAHNYYEASLLERDYVLLANPYYAVAESTMWAGRLDWVHGQRFPGETLTYQMGRNEGRGWALMWIGVYTLISLVLTFLVQLTFDRCLGRITRKKQPQIKASARDPLPSQFP